MKCDHEKHSRSAVRQLSIAICQIMEPSNRSSDALASQRGDRVRQDAAMLAFFERGLIGDGLAVVISARSTAATQSRR
jgi:hypothetical protein